jgi:mannose-1-phosphate guanylyltransferase
MHPLHDITPVILAGGKGIRLAPLSTEACPKPFISFADGTSLFTRTLSRVRPMRRAIVIGQSMHHHTMKHHAMRAGVRDPQLILEQHVGNTCAAIAAVVATVVQQPNGAQKVLAILPADHAILDIAPWHRALEAASARAMNEEVLVLIGIPPSNDTSAFGYFQVSDAGYTRAFREKPDNAAQLRREGWVWNSGQVIARAGVIKAALERYVPDIWQQALRSVHTAISAPNHLVLAPVPCIDKISFDHAVLEKADNLCAVISACGWSDIGTPEAFYAYNASTDITSSARALYECRPWGKMRLIGRTETSASKELVINTGCRLSLQRHHHRDEHWSIIEGEAEVTLDGTRYYMSEGDALLIPRGTWHRLSNAGTTVLRVHEVQSGIPDEADIERAEDDYGRV